MPQNLNRVTETKDLTGNPLYAEIIEVEKEISKFRSTSKNLSNYIPLVRIIDPIISALELAKSASYSAQIGQRRIAYNDVLLKRLQEEVATDTDSPCIQGSVLRDPESVDLSANELLSISLSMMAVSLSLHGGNPVDLSNSPMIYSCFCYLGREQHPSNNRLGYPIPRSPPRHPTARIWRDPALWGTAGRSLQYRRSRVRPGIGEGDYAILYGSAVGDAPSHNSTCAVQGTHDS